MDFWASSESDALSYAAVDKTRRAIEPILHETLRARFLSAKLLLRYVPIVMPPNLHDSYPPRTKARIKQRILECAPQIVYDPFVRGNMKDQVETYVDGIRVASLLLPRFGFSVADVRDFEMLLSNAASECGS